jgi:hypothetical protein
MRLGPAFQTRLKTTIQYLVKAVKFMHLSQLQTQLTMSNPFHYRSSLGIMTEQLSPVNHTSAQIPMGAKGLSPSAYKMVKLAWYLVLTTSRGYMR